MKEWYKVIGELPFISLAISGYTELFSILQEVFRHEDESRHWLRLSPTLHGFLDDFRWLAKDLMSRPTRIAEIIPNRHPATNGACDAAASGMGGVHLVPIDTKETPLLRRQRFLDWIRRDLCSFANPKGSITNSDLELAGSIANNDVLAQAVDVREKTTHNSYNNITAVFWQRK